MYVTYHSGVVYLKGQVHLCMMIMALRRMNERDLGKRVINSDNDQRSASLEDTTTGSDFIASLITIYPRRKVN